MEALFKQYYTALCLFSSKIVHNDLVAQDIVQEAFIRLHEERMHKEIKYCRSWLYKVVKNNSLNTAHKQKRLAENKNCYAEYLHAENNFTNQNAEQLIIGTEVSRQLWNEVYKLPSQMRQIVRMHFLESMSIREISLALHLHISTVKTQKQRGLALLRKYKIYLS